AAIGALHDEVRRLAAGGRQGRLLRDGAPVVFAGRPNTGESSLFNRLVGFNRALVTETPGTTRDVLSEEVDLSGVRTTLVDTAGVRATVEPIEAEGVRRAVAASDAAALTVVVLDRSVPMTSGDRELLERAAGALVVANKSDLPAAWTSSDVA